MAGTVCGERTRFELPRRTRGSGALCASACCASLPEEEVLDASPFAVERTLRSIARRQMCRIRCV